MGGLQQFAGMTRPDIAQAVGALAYVLAYPTVVIARAAEGVLKYLAGTLQLGLHFGNGSGLVAHRYASMRATQSRVAPQQTTCLSSTAAPSDGLAAGSGQ